jgi:hypothetical protein
LLPPTKQINHARFACNCPLNVGGTARYITQLANELPKHGIETFVATGFVQGAEVEDPSAQSIDVIRIPALGRSFNPIKDHLRASS